MPSGLVVPDVRNPQRARMREDAAAALAAMFRAAEAGGAGVMSIASGYRGATASWCATSPARPGVTGVRPDPWHSRYVGTTVSTGYHAGGWHTLEQYFRLPAAPTY